ncbi:hypothetical protein U1Q18_052010, partial [Sarracenia purpurea var. burkii]
QRELTEVLEDLFQKLRRRGFLVTPDDYEALRQSLEAGFGWSSPEALRELCISLWAKSRPEQEILTALFEQLGLLENEDWQLPAVPTTATDPEEKASSPMDLQEPHRSKVILKPVS